MAGLSYCLALRGAESQRCCASYPVWKNPTDGKIQLDGIDITSWEPKRRDIAMVFQNYALYPHMTVRENLEFGLKSRKISRDNRNKSIEMGGRAFGVE